MDRKQASSTLGTTDSSPHTTAAQRRASLLRWPNPSSLEPPSQTRSRSTSNAQDSQQPLYQRGQSISQASISSQDYPDYGIKMDAKRGDLKPPVDHTSDHDSDTGDQTSYLRRPRNAEEDVCYPFPSHYQEKSTFGPAADINLHALHDYLQSSHDQDAVRSQYGSEHVSKVGREKNYQDNVSRIDEAPIYNEFGDMRSKEEPVAERFVLYSVTTGSVKSSTLAELQHEGKGLESLLLAGNFWLDVTSPTDADMRTLSKVFGIHPLTTEDVLTEESREKCEIFRNYMFVCYRAFNQDHYSVDFLKPINFYNIVFRHGILTFHFEPSPHPHNVRKRARQLKDFINVTPDWINYAIIDDISDSFAPLIKQIEVEVDSIDDLVLLLRESEQSDMLRRIGSCRKRVMHLLRLLSSKAEVIRGLLKRSEDRIREGNYRHHDAATAFMSMGGVSSNANRSGTATPTQFGPSNFGRDGALRFIPSVDDRPEDDTRYTNSDVILYFGDIQDHIITMLQNLNHYETILSRAHSNYLAQISIELTQTSNSFNQTVSRLTVFATVLVPMNIITGLWGMNVRVPGESFQDLGYFFWIVACLAMFAVFSLSLAKRANLL